MPANKPLTQTFSFNLFLTIDNIGILYARVAGEKKIQYIMIAIDNSHFEPQILCLYQQRQIIYFEEVQSQIIYFFTSQSQIIFFLKTQGQIIFFRNLQSPPLDIKWAAP